MLLRAWEGRGEGGGGERDVVISPIYRTSFDATKDGYTHYDILYGG